MTVFPLTATLVLCQPLNRRFTTVRNAAVDGTAFSSSSSSKVMTRVVSFTAALTNLGGLVSGAVLLVTALPVNPGTSSFTPSASLSRFVPGV